MRDLFVWWLTTLYKHLYQSIMNRLSINYDLKWQHKMHTHYKWSNCGKLFNTQTGRQLKKTVNGRSVGYWIKGRFITLTILRNSLELIPKTHACPF